MATSKTALITGASSGLGAEFARQLAAQGYHLVLTARRLERLQALAAELSQRYAIQAEALAADLNDPAGVQAVEEKIAALPNLEILVNNAGFGIGGSFRSGDLDKHLSMIQVHVIASVRLAHAALPALLRRNRGGIINVSSVVAFMPARDVTYSATKVYLVNFSQALQTELLDTHVHVQALCPGFTYTEFHDTPEMEGFQRSSIPAFLWLKSEKVVADSLKDLRRGKSVCIPGWQYGLIVAIARSELWRPLLNFGLRWMRRERGR